MLLAQYTIRSKQEYIFRTNKIVEIVGASANISNAWDDLFECAEKTGLRTLRITDEPFDFDKVRNQMEQKDTPLNLAELFRGGGNLTVIFDSKETFVNLNKVFSFGILKDRPGMIPMAVCTDVTDDYRADYAALMEKSEIEKNRMNPGRDNFILPFSQMDRNTFFPYAGERDSYQAQGLLSYESQSKRKIGIKLRDENKTVKLLDDLVSGKGKESLLAVVHADGNNMGSKIMKFLGDDTDYTGCVNKMRQFSGTTARAFTDTGIAAMEKCRKELASDPKNKKLKESIFAYRVIVADGDDFTFICNARFAIDYTKSYIKAVYDYKSDWKYSSCAGICVFHSHYPFARAYSLAEQACDDGAKKMVHTGAEQAPEEGWVDFHYIHSGIGGNLETIRYREGTFESMARPWLLTDDSNPRSYSKLTSLYKSFKEYSVSRSVIKELGADWESSHSAGRQSLKRVCSKHPGLEKKLQDIFAGNNDLLMKAVFDLAEVIDIWYEEAGA